MKIKPMRGQIVVRELTQSGLLWLPDVNPRQVHTHVGRVLAIGPPALSSATAKGREVPPGFVVGDVVQFHLTSHEDVAKNVWEDGKIAHWIPQQNVDAVILDERIGTTWGTEASRAAGYDT